MDIPPIGAPNPYQPSRPRGPRKEGEGESVTSPFVGWKLENQTPQDLLSTLEELPESREEVIELGKKLAGMADYPSGETVRKLAELLLEEGDMLKPERD